MLLNNTNLTKKSVNSDAPEGLTVLTPIVTPVMLPLNDTNIISSDNEIVLDTSMRE
jgi:hypothetical protein